MDEQLHKYYMAVIMYPNHSRYLLVKGTQYFISQ